MREEYRAEDIEVLEGLEAVRRRPGMYIGGTDERGLHHLIEEIVDNSIDEAMAGFCTRIEVEIKRDGWVVVRDNGRGIPVEKHPKTGVSALQTVMTTLHSGAKFGRNAYKVCGGLHGVGASVVNALSSRFVAEVRRDGRIYRQEYVRGKPVTGIEIVGETNETGTTISFIPDKEIFRSINYNFEYISRFLREMAFLNRGIWIRVRDERDGRERNFYFEGGVKSLTRYLSRKKSPIHPSPIYIERSKDETIIEASLQYTDGFTETILSFANCINTEDGGSHLTGFRTGITRAINDYIKKYKLVKDESFKLSGEDVREGLIGIISVKLLEPQFEGQTKTRLGNPEIKGMVEGVVYEGLLSYLEEHPQDARAIVEKCISSHRAREAARKARELVVKKSSLSHESLPGKLADCTERRASARELFIVEGDSAGGSAKQGRDRRFQAILPLRGKILNVEKASLHKMLSHEEIKAIIAALGAKSSEDGQFDLSGLRYGKVIIMTDADVDGSHIRTLLLTFFFKYMRKLIEDGHLYIALPPLYRIKKGKEEYWVYSEEEKEEILERLGKGVEVQRYKGLGEMNPSQLWQTTMNPDTRTLLRVTIEDGRRASELIEILMGEEVPPRRAFIQAHAREVRNLDI